MAVTDLKTRRVCLTRMLCFRIRLERVSNLTICVCLRSLIGCSAAVAILFALALLASGQSSSIIATLAGQIVSEGFIRWRVSVRVPLRPPALTAYSYPPVSS